MLSFIQKHKLFLIYGSSLAVHLLLLRWLEFRFIMLTHGFEIYAGALAIIFTVLGIWLATKFIQPKTKIIEKQVYVSNDVFVRNEKAISELQLTSRETEVIELMAKGFSNAEIVKELFLSENTIKTHCANLFFKLEVKRRAQAVEKAKRMGIIS